MILSKWVLVERCSAGPGFKLILKENTEYANGLTAFRGGTRSNFEILLCIIRVSSL